MGDPVNAIRIFNDKQVDELLVLDISASKQRRSPDYKLIDQLAGECFMPLAYGGGISSVEQARKLFAAGVEKIVVQNAAITNPVLIRRLSEQFGSQSIMASVDIRKSWTGSNRAYVASRGVTLRAAWPEVLKSLTQAGAGEILLTSVRKDGTLSGPDLEIIKAASDCVDVPLIASGGISSLSDIKSAIDAGADAVAAGSFFVFHGQHRAVLLSYPNRTELERLLSAH